MKFYKLLIYERNAVFNLCDFVNIALIKYMLINARYISNYDTTLYLNTMESLTTCIDLMVWLCEHAMHHDCV